MKALTYLAIVLLVGSCQTADEMWMSDAERPIVLTAEGAGGTIVLTDARGKTLVMGPGYALSASIAHSYQPGDTIKP